MTRTRLYDLRLSRLPSLLGVCADNIPAIADAVNTAQRRLLYAKEAGEEGWWGTWAEMQFEITRENPYITTPRDVARLEAVTVCDTPVPLQNVFYEYLQFGNGRMAPRCGTSPRFNCGNIKQAYMRNNVVTFVELTEDPPQSIRVYPTNAADSDGQHRVFVGGLDDNGNAVYSQNIFQNAQGEFIILGSPFSTSETEFTKLNSVQKDITQGPVQIFQVNTDTGDEVLLLTMEPGETVASYRRYYFDNLPFKCCSSEDEDTIQVNAIAKLDLIPVACDTDYTLIQNMEAIILECQSMRYSEVDNAASKAMAKEAHQAAIRLLNGELVHFMGKNDPAVRFAPFGSATLQRRGIGTFI